LFLSIVVE